MTKLEIQCHRYTNNVLQRSWVQWMHQSRTLNQTLNKMIMTFWFSTKTRWLLATARWSLLMAIWSLAIWSKTCNKPYSIIGIETWGKPEIQWQPPVCHRYSNNVLQRSLSTMDATERIAMALTRGHWWLFSWIFFFQKEPQTEPPGPLPVSTAANDHAFMGSICTSWNFATKSWQSPDHLQPL